MNIAYKILMNVTLFQMMIPALRVKEMFTERFHTFSRGKQYTMVYYMYILCYSTMTLNIKGTDSAIFSIYSTVGTISGSIFSGCCLQH